LEFLEPADVFSDIPTSSYRDWRLASVLNVEGVAGMGMSMIADLFHHAACIICSPTDGTRPDVVCNCSSHGFSVAREDLAKRVLI